MTKPRTRTHKIHRKRRGPRRGFKSRSQRGGFLGFFPEDSNIPNNSYPTTETKTWYEKLFGKSTGQVESQEQAATARINQHGGRRKCTKCKKHHKHSRQCKK
jgi:hypothetical protein